jgi:hypothetical protein
MKGAPKYRKTTRKQTQSYPLINHYLFDKSTTNRSKKQMPSELLNPTVSTIKRFGKLRFHATPVTLTAGASYAIPGIVNFEKTGDKEWKGKAKVAQSSTRHVVMVLTSRSKEGEEYQRTKDYLTNDKFYKSAIHPAIVKLDLTIDTDYFACIEECESGRFYNDKPVMDWKVLATFKTAEDMKKAEDEHFAQFANNATAEAAALDIPEGWTAETWTPDLANQFATACAEVTGKPPVVATQLKAKIATDWGVPDSYVESHVIAF